MFADPAVILLACTLSHVRDPASEKMLWLTACGEQGHQTHNLGFADTSRRKALKRARAWIRQYRPRPEYTVSIAELEPGR